uniref:RING-type domain-containing protein n=1 Tax=Dicentrarchus labrax TaxID=13489 RepID=A0A8C4F0V2_DICLA
MPLFFKKRKPSDDSQKRLEYQLCRVRRALNVPSGAFSICKVLQKKVLILHNNELKSLVPRGCDISTLSTLKVLDLHENKLTSLPEDIGKLASLQILNAEKNRLKALPDSIGDLRLLQTLNLKGNCLSELPSSVCSLSSLRTLDVSDNNIVQLPKTLAYIRTLESFTLDAATMSYPPVSVCTEGTESIQRFLCSELGEEYCPPSQYLLPVLESDSGKQNSDCLDGLEEAWQNKFSDYEKRKVCDSRDTIAVRFSLSLGEQERLEQGVNQQQRAQEAERLLVLEKVRQAEDGISSRISNMLMDKNRQKKSAEFLQAMEEDRIRMEHLTAITQEETNSLRKRDVAASTHKHTNAISEWMDVNIANKSNTSLDRKFDNMLSLHVLDKSKAISHILQEEEMQKAAFQALQLQKDAVHGYIRNQIKLIEGELKQLTKLEIKRRSLDAENLQEVLVEQRTALSDLLQQLLKQRDQREQELRHVLAEMERKSESNQQNYWMIQYQRLLDAKPLSLRMQEAGVEKELVNLLCKLSAQHYLPILAHHRVTTEALRHMNSSDLKKVCLSLTTCSNSPFQHQLSYLSTQAPPPASPPLLPNISQIPSPPLTPGTPVTPSAPSPVEGPGSSECVVCMESGSQVIFLPCGHVCCCQVCSDALQNCPLCRNNISQRIRLYHS